MLSRLGTISILCLACAATLGGHVWLARHYERRFERLLSRTSPEVPILEFDPAEQACCFIQSPPPLDEQASPGFLLSSFENSTVESVNPPADALCPRHGVAESHATESSSTEVPVAPLVSRPSTGNQLDVWHVIEQEMPETTAEERDIWFEELKSLPPEAVRDLLKVRQQLRVLSPDHHISRPSRFPVAQQQDRGILDVEPILQSRTVSPHAWSETCRVLEDAIAWSNHNLANAETPGYKRIEVLLGDTYEFVENHGESAPRMPLSGRGLVTKNLRLDLRPGSFQETVRPLDLAIEGDGFFVVQDPDAHLLFTRCGDFTVNTHGQLCLRVAAQKLLDPPLTLPFDLQGLGISSRGIVSYFVQDQNHEQPVQFEAGTIKIARFTDPTQLIPVGHGLYRAPEKMEPILGNPGSPGFGVLKSGFLEQSNVDPDSELEIRENWEAILRSLPADVLPRTAREGSLSPN